MLINSGKQEVGVGQKYRTVKCDRNEEHSNVTTKQVSDLI